MANITFLALLQTNFAIKKLYPIILFKVDKKLKVDLYYTILSLGLAIYLQIKNNEKFLLNIEEIIQ